MSFADLGTKAANSSPRRTVNEQKIGDYYSSCMDMPAIDRTGLGLAAARA